MTYTARHRQTPRHLDSRYIFVMHTIRVMPSTHFNEMMLKKNKITRQYSYHDTRRVRCLYILIV